MRAGCIKCVSWCVCQHPTSIHPHYVNPSVNPSKPWQPKSASISADPTWAWQPWPRGQACGHQQRCTPASPNLCAKREEHNPSSASTHLVPCPYQRAMPVYNTSWIFSVSVPVGSSVQSSSKMTHTWCWKTQGSCTCLQESVVLCVLTKEHERNFCPSTSLAIHPKLKLYSNTSSDWWLRKQQTVL